MTIIWRGIGWLIPIIVLGAFLLANLIINSLYGDGYYKENEWPKIAAIIASSLIIAMLGYIFNYKKRKVYIDSESGKKRKSPSHTLFFIPLEAWAIIIPIFIFWVEYDSAKTDAEEMALINSPLVNDVYSVNFTKIFTETDKKFKYGTLKIVAIQTDGVEVIASETAYNKKSGLRKDIRKGKVYEQQYYAGDAFFLSSQRIIDLKNKDAIFQVSRNEIK